MCNRWVLDHWVAQHQVSWILSQHDVEDGKEAAAIQWTPCTVPLAWLWRRVLCHWHNFDAVCCAVGMTVTQAQVLVFHDASHPWYYSAQLRESATVAICDSAVLAATHLRCTRKMRSDERSWTTIACWGAGYMEYRIFLSSYIPIIVSSTIPWAVAIFS